MIGTGVKISIGIFLHKYSSRGSERGIGHNKEGLSNVQHFDYRGRHEDFLEFDECIILLFSPSKVHPFLCQVVERLGEHRKVGDQLLVEVTESNERSDHFNRFGWFPLLNSLELGGICYSSFSSSFCLTILSYSMPTYLER